MTFDRNMFANKLKRYCDQFETRITDLSSATGISQDRLQTLFDQKAEPTGDEVLIFADFFKCDYKFFISNEDLATFEQTESLFRKYGDDLTLEDKWAIQEFLFLCECEEFLMSNLPSVKKCQFSFRKEGNFYKKQGQDAAAALRDHLGLQSNQVPADVYSEFRKIGLHVFRRQLGKSTISGLCVLHPVAGKCVLVNYNEDTFRQRFSAAHEAGHAILNDETDPPLSFTKWDSKNLSEVRANTFASHFLMPPDYLLQIPDSRNWDDLKIMQWAIHLKVSAKSLVYALKESGLVDDAHANQLARVTVPKNSKLDPELPSALTMPVRQRKLELLKKGLSTNYVDLCFTAYNEELITAGRLSEMLLVEKAELTAVAALYGRKLSYGD